MLETDNGDIFFFVTFIYHVIPVTRYARWYVGRSLYLPKYFYLLILPMLIFIFVTYK